MAHEKIQGQERNIHQKMFGGHLMRLAFELAWSTSYLATRVTPVLNFVDDIHFLVPVEIGSLLQMNAFICHSDAATKQYLLYVTAEVVDPATGDRKITNEFFFALRTIDGSFPFEVVPESFDEIVRYFDGRRRIALSSKVL